MYSALAIFRELGDRRTEADVLSELGEAYLGSGRVAEAVAALSDSVAISASIGDRYGEAATLPRLARAQQLAGAENEARKCLVQAVRVFEELGDSARAAQVRKQLTSIVDENADSGSEEQATNDRDDSFLKGPAYEG